MVLEGKVTFADYGFNFQEGLYKPLTWLMSSKWAAVETARKDPTIVHYTSGEKPWHKECKHPLKQEYDYYMQLWPELKEKKTRAHSRLYHAQQAIISKLQSLYHFYYRKSGGFIPE